MNNTSEYPEHEKQRKVLEKSQVIGEFIEWLRYEGYDLISVEYNSSDFPIINRMPGTISQILARYFDIDLNKLEEEKRDILNKLRESATLKQV